MNVLRCDYALFDELSSYIDAPVGLGIEANELWLSISDPGVFPGLETEALSQSGFASDQPTPNLAPKLGRIRAHQKIVPT